MFDRSMFIMDNYLDQLRQKSFQDLNDNIIKLKKLYFEILIIASSRKSLHK